MPTPTSDGPWPPTQRSSLRRRIVPGGATSSCGTPAATSSRCTQAPRPDQERHVPDSRGEVAVTPRRARLRPHSPQSRLVTGRLHLVRYRGRALREGVVNVDEIDALERLAGCRDHKVDAQACCKTRSTDERLRHL